MGSVEFRKHRLVVTRKGWDVGVKESRQTLISLTRQSLRENPVQNTSIQVCKRGLQILLQQSCFRLTFNKSYLHFLVVSWNWKCMSFLYTIPFHWYLWFQSPFFHSPFTIFKRFNDTGCQLWNEHWIAQCKWMRRRRGKSSENMNDDLNFRFALTYSTTLSIYMSARMER